MAYAAARGGAQPEQKGNAGQTGDTSGNDGGTAGIVRNKSHHAVRQNNGGDSRCPDSGAESGELAGGDTTQHFAVQQIECAGSSRCFCGTFIVMLLAVVGIMLGMDKGGAVATMHGHMRQCMGQRPMLGEQQQRNQRSAQPFGTQG